MFSSVRCLRTLYLSLVRPILEYGMIVWHPYLAKDQLRLERVQNRFLSYVSFLLKIEHPPHDYSPVLLKLNIPTLSFRRFDADSRFIQSLLDGSIDAPDLLSSINFLRVQRLTVQHVCSPANVNAQNIYSTQNNDPLTPNQANDCGNLITIDQPKKHSLAEKLKLSSNKIVNVTSPNPVKRPAPSTTSQPPSPKSSHSFNSPLTMKSPNAFERKTQP
ncbi:hypothetical protein QTP88_006355 [Uroleucon formosanum]